jgi:hypothetical protein
MTAMWASLQDIYGMSCCTRIIGSCMSQVSRIAADLMYAKGLMRAPPVGFDCESCRYVASSSSDCQ